MPYESAPELSAFFKRMGVALQVVDDPALGKFVTTTADIFPDVVEAGKPNAGTQLETAALFEESGIASWPTSELLYSLQSNYAILNEKAKESNGKPMANIDALLGFCNETLALCFAEKGSVGNTMLTVVPDTLFGTDEESTGIAATAATATTSTPATTTPFLYATAESQQSDTISAAILGPRGALRSLRKFHTELERKAIALEQSLIPISVESIARAIVTAVVRFLRALERSVKAHFKTVHPSTTMDKKLVILRELFASVDVSSASAAAATATPTTVESLVASPSTPAAAKEEPKDKNNNNKFAPNPFVANLFEASVRPFNRLVEPPEGSEFEASVKTKEWCRTIRNAIQQNILDVVNSFSAALICEMAAPASVQPAVAASYGLQLAAGASCIVAASSPTDSNAELSALLSVLPTSAVKTLTLKCPLNPLTTAKPIVPLAQLKPLLEWVPSVAQGWLNDSTIVTLLGQMTINAQALTAVSEQTSASVASVQVVQVKAVTPPEESDTQDGEEDELVTKQNVHQRVPIFGAAVFTLQSCFNHSCAPNAEVVPTLPFGMGGHDIVVQAIPKNKRISSKGKIGGGGADDDDEDDAAEEKESKKEKSDKASKKDKKDSKKEKVKPVLKEGEEVNITYIPTLYLALDDYVARRARLESYFFVCECKRCFRENAKAEKAEAKKKTKEAKQ